MRRRKGSDGCSNPNKRLDTANIPPKYLPLAGSGFDEKGYEDYALELKGNVSAYRSTLNRLRKGLVKKVVAL